MFDKTLGKDIAMLSAKGCCTATTMALTSIKQKFEKYRNPVLEWKTAFRKFSLFLFEN